MTDPWIFLLLMISIASAVLTAGSVIALLLFEIGRCSRSRRRPRSPDRWIETRRP